MKNLIIILLLASSSLMAQNSKQQKFYRVVEYFKPEGKFTYFHWSTDSIAQAKVANIKTDFGVVYRLETKVMTQKQAERENKKMDRRIERGNYSHIKDPN